MGVSVTRPLSVSSIFSVGAPLRTLSSMSEKLLSFFCLSLMVSSSYSDLGGGEFQAHAPPPPPFWTRLWVWSYRKVKLNIHV